MKFFRSLPKLQTVLFTLLIGCCGVLGYLFYDSHRTNIENRELIADAKIENKDLSQDLEIIKNKHSKLQQEVDLLKTKVAKVSYHKKVYKRKHLYSAGRSSKYKHHYRRYKVNYRKLYIQLRNRCVMNKRMKHTSYRYR